MGRGEMISRVNIVILYMTITLCFVYVSLSTPSVAGSAINVKKEGIMCVVNNIANYNSLGDDPIIIIISRCPDFIFRGLTPRLNVNKNSKTRNVIKLSKKNLYCLKRLKRNIIQIDKEIIAIDFSICSAE